jgi:hypothetical protein
LHVYVLRTLWRKSQDVAVAAPFQPERRTLAFRRWRLFFQIAPAQDTAVNHAVSFAATSSY